MAGAVTVRMSLKSSLEEVIPAALRERMLRAAAVEVIGRIQRRTEDGKDVDGNPFAPYSAGYAKARAGSGRGTTPNLHLTGAMLGSMQIVSSDAFSARIGFAGSSAPVHFARQRTPSGRVSRKGGHTHRLARGSSNAPVSNALKAFYNDSGGRVVRHFFGMNAEDAAAAKTAALKALRLK
jgi:hypothetical protein